MTRKALARHAAVSERYLAQLESGKGNCSIVLLRRIAHAIGVPVAQLVSEVLDPPIDVVLLNQFIERLPAARVREARSLLVRHFQTAHDDLRRSRIALIGLRGGGKSTVGSLLAEKLRVPFIELDREIERIAGTSLENMFEMFGQDTFRRFERDALNMVLQQQKQFVLATGGSIVTDPTTFELLLSSCLTVWIKAEPADHMTRVTAQGDLRPMARNPRAMDDLIAILKSREPLYAQADTTVDTSGKSPERSLAGLLRFLGSTG
jgi:XRE family aerobic/anaerobic benzoate catabolism transcriptional regulator